MHRSVNHPTQSSLNASYPMNFYGQILRLETNVYKYLRRNSCQYLYLFG